MAIALAAGCDGSTPPGDAGDEDGGGEEFDAGPDEDAGRPVGCSLAGVEDFPSLPDECLPRCAMATRTCVEACGDEACERGCVDGDDTPSTMLDLGTGEGGMIDLDCALCFDFQLTSCEYASCPDEVAGCLNCAADQCDRLSAGCEAQESALDACLAADMSAFSACVDERASACFAP